MYSTTILFLLLLYGVKSDNTSCTEDNECNGKMMNGSCNSGQCECSYGYYQYNSTVCVQCPGEGEDCRALNCCARSSVYLSCISGVCQCMESYSGLNCWNINSNQRYRFQKVAQFILAIGLIFTSIIIVILFWKACSSGVHTAIPHVDSFVSLNSIQRLVLLRLQDRPPTYNQIYQPMKRQATSRRVQTLTTAPVYEEPPPYSESPGDNHVYENRIFIINEQATSDNIDTNTTEIPVRVASQPLSVEHKPELHI